MKKECFAVLGVLFVVSMMRKRLVIAWLISALVLVCVPVQAQSSGDWLDPAWNKRSVVTISNPGGTVLTDFQVHVVLDSSFDFTKAKSDGSDIRFTGDDGISLVPFWIEKWDPVNNTASLWVKVPSIPSYGTTLYLYYDNPAAVSASNGNATFEFFDDFESGSTGNTLLGYYDLGAPRTVLVQDQPWELTPPHTLSVVEADNGGYTYWGYYGLYNGCGGIGLAFSNDLVNWTKYSGNPLFFNGRWPSVLKVGYTFYMLYTKDYCGTSYIKLATSTNGINFTDVKTIVMQQNGYRNQNPNLFYNQNDGKYYIYWFNGGGSLGYTIRVRSAATIEGLDDTGSETVVLQSNSVLAAPNMLFYDGTYFLSVESQDSNGWWEVLVYASTSPAGGFSMLPGDPVLANGSACMFQHVFGNYLHEYYCKQGATWTVEHRVADLTAGRLEFHEGALDPTKWISGGSWAVTTDTQQDGSVGSVAQGSIGSYIRQVLLSLYQGSDYVLETYGKQQSGRVWGVGVRATDQNNLYSINLYEDLDGTNNLYVYDWVNGSASTLTRTAVGMINANTWYKLSVKVHSNSLDVYKDNVLMIQTSSSQYAFGAVALYGERNTLAEFNNVLVRKYTATEPSATVESNITPVVASVSVNPSSVVGGNTSQGTVVLSSAAPSGGAVVSLGSSNPSVASVPATVTVQSGNTSATFTVSTNTVTSSTQVTISASYGTTLTVALAVTSPTVTSVSVNPTSVVGGNSSQGAVVLSSAALSGGAVVLLDSSNPLVASVPPTVTVQSGNTSATFTVNTSAVPSSTQVTISAGYGGTTQIATLTVRVQSGGDWLDPAWNNRSAVTISNPGGTVLNDFQVHVTLDGSFDFTRARSDGSDVRFTSDDGFTLIPFWIEAWNPGNRTASFWVKMSTIPTGGTTLYLYYGNLAAASTSSGTVTFEFFDDFDSGSTALDPGKWSATGGTWVVTTDTQQDGTVGGVVQGTIGSNIRQVLRSTYSGSDYVLEAYGRQLSGRVWGLGVRATDQNNLYSINLYEDLDGTNNLYVYNWVNGSAPTLARTAVGVVNSNTWYKLSVKVHSNSIDVYKDNVLMIQTSSSQYAFGAVALYGERNTLAEFNNVLVRKYTATEPSATVESNITPVVTSVSVNPSSVVGGNSSQGTVVLSSATPSGGAVVSLDSSNPSVASVPATVTVPSGSTSATFTVNTSAVPSSTQVTISASYGGTTQIATLTVRAQSGGDWLDPAWNNRSAVTISNPGGTLLSNFQVHVTLDSSFDFTRAKSDGSDVRFTGDDGFTLIPFWIEKWDSNNKIASLWVRVPTIPSGGTTLYMYYGNPIAVSASSGTATFEFFDNFDSQTLDTSKWSATGGTWLVTTDTQQDGTVGGVARGTIGSNIRQVLLSSYQGSDYVLEAYGKLLSGRVWGIGVRSTDQNNLYSINLYEDLDGTNNLYVYNWVNGGASTLSRTAVGMINANTWYKLSVKVHSNSLDVYKDNVLMIQTSASQYGSGTVALYGEQNTMAEFNNVLVRKYAAVEPSATVSP